MGVNAWALVIIVLGVFVIVVGWRRTQGNILTAITGKGEFKTGGNPATISPSAVTGSPVIKGVVNSVVSPPSAVAIPTTPAPTKVLYT